MEWGILGHRKFREWKHFIIFGQKDRVNFSYDKNAKVVEKNKKKNIVNMRLI